MKTVDENYKYEELEGFKPFDPELQAMRDEIVMLEIHGRQLIFSKTACELMGSPDYVTVRINEERQLILFQKSTYEEPAALRMRTRNVSNKVKNVTENQKLKLAIEQISRRDLQTVNVIAEGYKARSVRDAVIFDFRKIRVTPKRLIGNAKKKAEQNGRR